MKKTILMIPEWYPTKENKAAGSFFKEQARFISQEYNVLVLTISRKNTLFLEKTLLEEGEKDTSIEEYHAYLDFSVLSRILEKINSFFDKSKYKNKEGIGRVYSEYYKKKLKKRLEKLYIKLNKNYDIVYGISAQGIAGEVKIFSDLNHTPLVIGEHGPFPWPGTTNTNLIKETYESADVFFAISKDKIRQIMLQNIRLRQVVYIGNLIDESKFLYEPLEHREKTLLIVAANSFYKNYELFIETINKLVKKTKYPFRVIIAGYDSNKGYSKNAELLEEKVRRSSFYSIVEMIRELSREEMVDLYQRADAFVLTSIQEGQPVVALEAACCGLPLFVTRCGGVEDYITDKIGRIVDICDSDLLSEYLRQFLDGEIQFDPKYIREQIISRYGRQVYMSNVINGFEIAEKNYKKRKISGE